MFSYKYAISKITKNTGGFELNIVINKNIKEFLEEHGIRQTDLAKNSGISRQALNNICSNRSLPSLETAFLISRALNTPLENIFYAEEI